MATLPSTKRLIAALLPYRKSDAGLEYYLQKRGEDARILKGKFGLFGGGVEEGESIHEGLIRELHEELEYTPRHVIPLGIYESPYDIVHLFVEEVDDSFEQTVVVHEGEYGTFIQSARIPTDVTISALVKLAVEQFETTRLSS